MKPDLVFGFESAMWPVLVTDRSGTLLRFNSNAAQAFGSVLQSGVQLSLIWSPENPLQPQAFLDKWEKQPAASHALKFNVRGIYVSYTTVVCAVSQESQSLFMFQLFPDIGGGLGSAGGPPIEATMQKQKLDVALQLSRSVVLDFKNALGGVLGHSSLLLMQAEPDHPWRKSLVEIEKAVTRGMDAASSLGTFISTGRDQKSAQAGGSLNQVAQKAAESLKEAAAARSVEWDFQFERRLFSARFDEIKVQQAFARVLQNAIESMPSGGRVRISTKSLELSQPTHDRSAKLAAGAYVCAEFSDTGCGMEEAVLSRIFEPFFTTKPTNKHRGLGLPWVYGIITNLGGAIAVSSQPGVGTSVRVYLPAQKQLVDDVGPAAVELRGTETILLVDDEEVILTMGQTVLATFGYNVLIASSGTKALEMLRKPDIKVDLLVSDLIMPGVSGTELVEQVQKLAPRIRIIMISGALTGGEQGSVSYLPKPFTSRQLLEKVRGALSRTQPGSNA